MKHYRYLVIVALLITLLSAQFPTLAQNDAPLVLARVPLSAAAELPIYAELEDATGTAYALVRTSRAMLQSSAAPYQILDVASAETRYLVALERRPGARMQAPALANVIYDDGRQIIARDATPAQAAALSEAGFALYWLPEAPPATTTRDLPAVTMTYSPLVAEMIAQVTQSAVYDYTADLSGERPAQVGGAPYTITTRHTGSGTPLNKATQYAYEHLEAWGLDPSYHYWTISWCGSNRNVIGELPGATMPDELVLITAHIDDMPSSGLAPGADDNASGTVGVLLAAEIMSQYQFERTVRFVLFTGEEQGLCGSRAYAAQANANGDDIVAVLNLDMIAWNTPDSAPVLRLHTRQTSNPGYSADLVIAQTFVDVVAEYGLSYALIPIIDPDGITASDHSSFWNNGYPAILAIEDDENDLNPRYHTSQDLLQYLDMVYYTNFVRASLGTVAHLAIPFVYPPALAIDKHASTATISAGEPFTYTLTVTNTGGAATGVAVSDTLPAHTSLEWISDRGALEGDAVVWRALSLDADETRTVSFGVTVGCVPSGTVILNEDYQVTATEWPTPTVGPPVSVTVWGDAPIAAFTLAEPALLDYPVQFTNLSTQADTYSWDFGDGITSTQTHPTHTFAHLSPHTVALTAMGGCFSDTVTRTVAIHEYGVALGSATNALTVTPGTSFVYTVAVTNTGTLTEAVALSITPADGWHITPLTRTLSALGVGASAQLPFTVTMPLTATPGATTSFTVTALSASDPRPTPATARLTWDVAIAAPPPGYQLFLPLFTLNNESATR